MKEKRISMLFDKFVYFDNKSKKYKEEQKDDNNRVLEEKNKQPTTNGKTDNSVNEK